MFSSLKYLQNTAEIKLELHGNPEQPGNPSSSLNAPSQGSGSNRFKAEELVSAIPSEEETESTSFTEENPDLDPEETGLGLQESLT